MKEIKLTQNKVALVDDEDYERINAFKWHAWKHHSIFYGARTIRENGKRTILFMHHFIFGKPLNNLMHDHKDGNGLNNQQTNVLLVTNRQNGQNRHDKRSSQYPGVSWYKDYQKWRAVIQINGKFHHLGYFTEEIQAFIAYQKAIVNLGEQIHENYA